MGFFLAMRFLTIIPINLRGAVDERKLARAMAYFPAVGLFLGILAAALNALLSSVLTAATRDLISIAFLVIITGNLHGDGLMDTADGVFSGRPREGMLEIMKDSRVGSHGVIAGGLMLLVKFVLLGQLPQGATGLALILMPALGRWAQVYGATVYPYARKAGGTGGFTAHVKAREIFWASLTVLLAIVLTLGWWGGFLVAGVLIGTAGLARYISGRLNGLTGDTLGAMNEWAEVLVLIILQIMAVADPGVLTFHLGLPGW